MKGRYSNGVWNKIENGKMIKKLNYIFIEVNVFDFIEWRWKRLEKIKWVLGGENIYNKVWKIICNRRLVWENEKIGVYV